MAIGFRVHKVEPMLGNLAVNSNPRVFTVHVNSIHKIFCEKMCLVE